MFGKEDQKPKIIGASDKLALAKKMKNDASAQKQRYGGGGDGRPP